MSDSGGCCACNLNHASATDYVGETPMWNLGRAVPVAAGRSGSPCAQPPFLPRLKEHKDQGWFIMLQKVVQEWADVAWGISWLMFSDLRTLQKSNALPGTWPNESPPIMEALEQALTVRAPSPGRKWGAQRTDLVRVLVLSCWAGTTSLPLAQPGSAPDLELLQGYPISGLWGTRCHRSVTSPSPSMEPEPLFLLLLAQELVSRSRVQPGHG